MITWGTFLCPGPIIKGSTEKVDLLIEVLSFFLRTCQPTIGFAFSRVGNLRKGPYFVRKKNPSVIWILNA